ERVLSLCSQIRRTNQRVRQQRRMNFDRPHLRRFRTRRDAIARQRYLSFRTRQQPIGACRVQRNTRRQCDSRVLHIRGRQTSRIQHLFLRHMHTNSQPSRRTTGQTVRHHTDRRAERQAVATIHGRHRHGRSEGLEGSRRDPRVGFHAGLQRASAARGGECQQWRWVNFSSRVAWTGIHFPRIVQAGPSPLVIVTRIARHAPEGDFVLDEGRGLSDVAHMHRDAVVSARAHGCIQEYRRSCRCQEAEPCRLPHRRLQVEYRDTKGNGPCAFECSYDAFGIDSHHRYANGGRWRTKVLFQSFTSSDGGIELCECASREWCRITDQPRREVERQILGKGRWVRVYCLVEHQVGRQLEWMRARLPSRGAALFFGHEFVIFDTKRWRGATKRDGSAGGYARGVASGDPRFVVSCCAAGFGDNVDFHFDLIVGREAARKLATQRGECTFDGAPSEETPFETGLGFDTYSTEARRQMVCDLYRSVATVYVGVTQVRRHHDKLAIGPSLCHDLGTDRPPERKCHINRRDGHVGIFVNARYHQGSDARGTAGDLHVARAVYGFKSRLHIRGCPLRQESTRIRCAFEVANRLAASIQSEQAARFSSDLLNLILR